MKKWIPLNTIYYKSCISVIVINIFLLLLYYYDKLYTRTVVNGKNNCVDIEILYETLDKEKVKSLSGFCLYIRSVIKLVDSGDTQKKLV